MSSLKHRALTAAAAGLISLLVVACSGTNVAEDGAVVHVRIDGDVTLQSYEQVLHRRIAREARRQPLGKHLNDPQVVEIELELRRDGSLSLAKIASSSGNETVDELILSAVVAGSPYPEPPSDQVTTSLEFDIELRLVPMTASR